MLICMSFFALYYPKTLGILNMCKINEDTADLN